MIKSPSKYIPLKKLKEIQLDHNLSSEYEYDELELRDAVARKYDRLIDSGLETEFSIDFVEQDRFNFFHAFDKQLQMGA